MNINYLQHVSFEGLENIADWARANSHEVRATRLFAGESLPGEGEFDFLIILGGSMNVDEESKFPFLSAEKRFIEKVIEQGKPVLGICLGSQLVADVLGAKVYRNDQKEIGWFSVEALRESESVFAEVLPSSLMTFHWHGDTFDLPDGSIRLASSAACINQAFSYGDKVLGLQFHAEATPDAVSLMIQNEGEEIRREIAAGAKYVQTAERITSPENQFAENARVMSDILDALVQKAKRVTKEIPQIK